MNCPDCENGESCGRGPAECPVQRASALAAGIPASVIDGKSKLSDHFDETTIRIMSASGDRLTEMMAEARRLK